MFVRKKSASFLEQLLGWISDGGLRRGGWGEGGLEGGTRSARPEPIRSCGGHNNPAALLLTEINTLHCSKWLLYMTDTSVGREERRSGRGSDLRAKPEGCDTQMRKFDEISTDVRRDGASRTAIGPSALSVQEKQQSRSSPPANVGVCRLHAVLLLLFWAICGPC